MKNEKRLKCVLVHTKRCGVLVFLSYYLLSSSASLNESEAKKNEDKEDGIRRKGQQRQQNMEKKIEMER